MGSAGRELALLTKVALLQALLRRAVCQIRALVVLPTKELAQQVCGPRVLWQWCGAQARLVMAASPPGEQSVQHLHRRHSPAGRLGHRTEATVQGAGEPGPEDVGPLLGCRPFREADPAWGAGALLSAASLSWEVSLSALRIHSPPQSRRLPLPG